MKTPQEVAEELVRLLGRDLEVFQSDLGPVLALKTSVNLLAISEKLLAFINADSPPAPSVL